MHRRCSTDGVSRFKACDSYILPAGCKEIIERTGCARKPLRFFLFLEISGLHFSLLSSESNAGLPPSAGRLWPLGMGRPNHVGESRKEQVGWESQDSGSVRSQQLFPSQQIQDQSAGLEKESQGEHRFSFCTPSLIWE